MKKLKTQIESSWSYKDVIKYIDGELAQGSQTDKELLENANKRIANLEKIILRIINNDENTLNYRKEYLKNWNIKQ